MVGVVVAFAVPRVGELVDLGPRLGHARALTAGLERAIDAAGGARRVLACGRPAVGRYRGTMLAYALDVPKRTVRADGEPGGATFRSRLTPRSPAAPQVPGGPVRTLAVAGGWRVLCAA